MKKLPLLPWRHYKYNYIMGLTNRHDREEIENLIIKGGFHTTVRGINIMYEAIRWA